MSSRDTAFPRMVLTFTLLMSTGAVATGAKAQTTGIAFVNEFFQVLTTAFTGNLGNSVDAQAFRDQFPTIAPLPFPGPDDAVPSHPTDSEILAALLTASLEAALVSAVEIGDLVEMRQTDIQDPVVDVSPGAVFIGDLDDLANLNVVSGLVTVTTTGTETVNRTQQVNVSP